MDIGGESSHFSLLLMILLVDVTAFLMYWCRCGLLGALWLYSKLAIEIDPRCCRTLSNEVWTKTL